MLDDESLKSVVIEAIEAACKPSIALCADSRLEDIGLDSLGLATVISAVEDTFAIRLSPDQLMSFLQVSTIGEILQVIHGTETMPADQCR